MRSPRADLSIITFTIEFVIQIWSSLIFISCTILELIPSCVESQKLLTAVFQKLGDNVCRQR